MSTLLIKNARYIVSCDDTDRLYERSNLFIRDNAIEYIGPELRQADQVIDAMKEVGDLMDVSLRETGRGGLAATRRGVEIRERLRAKLQSKVKCADPRT